MIPAECPVLCDECWCETDGESAIVTPFGTFCSDECATDAEADYFDHMQKRGYTEEQTCQKQ